MKFSPFQENLLAVATSQNYGIEGAGKLDILGLNIYFFLKRNKTRFAGYYSFYDPCKLKK